MFVLGISRFVLGLGYLFVFLLISLGIIICYTLWLMVCQHAFLRICHKILRINSCLNANLVGRDRCFWCFPLCSSSSVNFYAFTSGGEWSQLPLSLELSKFNITI